MEYLKTGGDDMDFLQGFLLIGSIIMMSYMCFYAYQRRNKNGGIEFFWLMLFSILWSASNFMENISLNEGNIMLWRNIQQLFVFGTPFISLLFAVKFTYSLKYIKVLYVTFVIQVTSVLLIFTDSLHHLMREEVFFVFSQAFGKNLVVQATPLGTILVTFNFILGLVAIVVLVNYGRKINQAMKRRIDLLALSFFLVFMGAFVKLAFLDQIEYFISISVLYIPGALLMFFVLFKYDFLNINPIGRDRVFEYINQGIIITDENRTITDINSIAQKWVDAYFKKDQTKVIGQTINDLFSHLINQFNINVDSTEDTFEVDLSTKPPLILKVHRFPFLNKKNEMIGLILILTDITQSKHQEHILEYYASHDRLTDTFNRIAFENIYEDMLYKETSMISMIMIDIDDFKHINDSYGHVFGDQVLKSLSETIKENTSGIFGRLGGEEFGIIIPSKDRNEAYLIAEKIRLAVGNLILKTNSQEKVTFTISLGVSDNQASLKLFEYIRHEADLALYKAKETGKNKSVIYKK